MGQIKKDCSKQNKYYDKPKHLDIISESLEARLTCKVIEVIYYILMQEIWRSLFEDIILKKASTTS